MTKILIIEDDASISSGIKTALQNKGYTAYEACNKKDALKMLNNNIDLILLDVNLPDANGIMLCRQIKQIVDIPTIFVTVNDEESDIIKGFEAGGEDFVTKPFSVPVLLKRIEVVINRAKENSKSVYLIDDLSYDITNQTMKKCGEQIKLTHTESKILLLLIINKNNILTREKLLEKVWDVDGNFVDEKALNVNISRLRQKIEDNPHEPKYIKTVFGIGYKWSD